jgi:PAS domain S-box-containing protein
VRFRLHEKIVLYTVGIVIVLVVVFTGLRGVLSHYQLKNSLFLQTAELARSIEPAIRNDLYYKRMPQVRRLIRSYYHNNSVEGVRILDEEKRLITDGFDYVEPVTPLPIDLAEPPKSAQLIKNVFVWSAPDGLVRALLRVETEEGKTFGYVEVLASDEETRWLLRQRLALDLILGGLLGILACFLGFYAGRRLTRPLDELTAAVEAVALDEPLPELQIDSSDEIGQLASAFENMYRQRIESEASLKRSTQHLEFVLRETPVGYIEWDSDFRVLQWNKASERIFGYRAEEAIGKLAADLIIPEDLQSRIGQVMNLLVRGEGGEQSNNRNIRSDGSEIFCEWHNTLIRDEDGNLSSIASLVIDNTEQVESRQKMRQAMEAAQMATRSKSEFLANMSHEIRTPMNGVIGLTDLLLHTELTEEQRSYLEIISSSGELLLTIINDILDLSKIESGKYRLEETVFDLPDCLGKAFRLFEKSLQAKKLKHSCKLRGDLPRWVSGDPNRLRQIIHNLFSNAIKFTQEGSIDMEAWAEKITSRRMRVFVSVRDTGAGIAKADADRIFQPFHQADSSATRSVGGTGLGLTISRHLCRLMRGDIFIQDTKIGKGTCFTFHVEFQVAPDSETHENTLVESAPPAASAIPEGSANPQNNQLRILIVEDNSVNRIVAQRILKKIGHESAWVENGQEALEYVRQHPVELIFMDLQMPVMDGFEATAAIREEFGRKHHIVALTASAIEGDRERCLKGGMDDYISKPIHIENVRTILERLSPPKEA